MTSLFACCGWDDEDERVRHRVSEYRRKRVTGMHSHEAGLQLLLAAKEGRLRDVIGAVERKVADINISEPEKGSPKFGRTALIWAIENRHVAVVQWLINQPETDLNCSKLTKSGGTRSALYLAAADAGTEEGIDIVRMLLKKTDRISVDPDALAWAKKSGSSELVALLEQASSQAESEEGKQHGEDSPLLPAGGSGSFTSAMDSEVPLEEPDKQVPETEGRPAEGTAAEDTAAEGTASEETAAEGTDSTNPDNPGEDI